MTSRIVLISFASLAIASAAEPTKIGETLPVIAGEALSGHHVELPAADTGSERVLVVSFAKSASGDSRAWTQQIEKETGPNRPVSYRVIVLESVPRLVRGMAVAGIRSGVPKPLWDKTILLYKDEKEWKKRLGVTSDGHSYVVLIDGDGVVRWLGAGPFSETTYGQLRQEIQNSSPQLR